jgi:LL-diaminopimelate aminotransferase
MKINKHYLELENSYLFKTIAKKAAEYKNEHPEADIIKMGIGDVTLPLPECAVKAMGEAVSEMGKKETFHGYPESFGEDFLLSAIKSHYEKIGVKVDTDEIVATSGAKEDVANILDIFSDDVTVLIPDPVYPVYLDTNIMAGHKVIFSEANGENGFLPMPDGSKKADIIYLCSPNNPTGAAYDYDSLKKWVDFALATGAVIFYDAAYEMFITDDSPRSIFLIPGAEKCAIEFCSFSKTAGFTGVRCGYTVIKKELTSDGVRLLDLWKRRQSTKFNGVSYIVSRGAAAVFSDEGEKEIRENIAYYRENTKMMTEAFSSLGFTYYGGKNSPYVWLSCPFGMKSWEFFDFLLEKCNVIATPGEGFGSCGEGYIRLSGFGTHEKTREAMERIKRVCSDYTLK